MFLLGQENLANVNNEKTENRMSENENIVERAMSILAVALIDQPGSRLVVRHRDENFDQGDFAEFVAEWFDGRHEAAALVESEATFDLTVEAIGFAVLNNYEGL